MTVDVVPGPTLPVWTGPSDIAVVATRTGAGRYAVTPAYEAARRGVSLLGIGAEDAPLHAACSTRPRALRGAAARPGCSTRRCGRC